ncbi:ribonuclease H-like domain-containing protein [Tanacetum coccineum]
METQAIDDQDHLVNYDNDNENDDFRYRSEEYFDETHEEDENNNSNGNVVKWGITRLYKFRMEYRKPDGIKLSVTFDALNRISGKHIALFLIFLGDMVREHIGLKILSWKKVDSEARDKLWDEITLYFDVDLTVRKLVMNRLGQLLRNLRRKLRQTYILPNQNTLSKLNEVLAKYSAILKAEEWVNFLKYTTTEKYKVKSSAAKMARSKSIIQHTMGRGGYTLVKDKMIQKKEIKPDEEPPRGTLWLKGRVNKDGEYPDDEIRSAGDKLKETEDKVKEGTLKVDHGTNAMTVVLGKEKVYPVDINPINSSADEEGGTTVVGCENDASIQKSIGLATLEKEMETRETVKSVRSKKMTRSIRKDSSRQDSQSQENMSLLLVLPQAIKCKLWHLKKSTIIALGIVYKTDGKQMLQTKNSQRIATKCQLIHL